MNRVNVAKLEQMTLSVRFGLLFVAVCLGSGCSSTRNAVIPAAELPFEYRAANQTFRRPLDLSFLASQSLNNDLVYPGDVLDITVVSGAEKAPPEALSYRVNPDGTLELPIIGQVPVAGLTMQAAEEQIRQFAISNRIYRDPTVSVLLAERQNDKVRVVGAVNEPGDYEIPRAGNDLLAAVIAAGGLSDEAGEAIEIRHRAQLPPGGVAQAGFEPTAPQSVHVDLADVMSGQRQDYSLYDGTVVMVKNHVPRTVYVHGLVKQDGEFDLPKDQPLRVTQAIALAGGREIEFADKVYVSRFLDGRNEPIIFEVSLSEAKTSREANPVLMPGDVVSVEETPTTFAVDFLRNFFRFGLTSAIPGF